MLLLRPQKNKSLEETPALIETANIAATAESETESDKIIKSYAARKGLPTILDSNTVGSITKLKEQTQNESEEPVCMEGQDKVNNRVIIRIWNSSLNGGHNVGHVSIETPKNYISLWPAGNIASDSGPIKQFFETRPYELLSGVAYDVRAERRPAEITICLYKLNVAKMEYEFKKIKERLNGWTLFGPNRLINNGSPHSCASLALTILRAGDLDLDYLIFSSSVTPDKMAEAMIAAKKAELKEHPETVDFNFDDETRVELFTYNKTYCTLS